MVSPMQRPGARGGPSFANEVCGLGLRRIARISNATAPSAFALTAPCALAPCTQVAVKFRKSPAHIAQQQAQQQLLLQQQQQQQALEDDHNHQMQMQHEQWEWELLQEQLAADRRRMDKKRRRQKLLRRMLLGSSSAQQEIEQIMAEAPFTDKQLGIHPMPGGGFMKFKGQWDGGLWEWDWDDEGVYVPRSFSGGQLYAPHPHYVLYTLRRNIPLQLVLPGEAAEARAQAPKPTRTEQQASTSGQQPEGSAGLPHNVVALQTPSGAVGFVVAVGSEYGQPSYHTGDSIPASVAESGSVGQNLYSTYFNSFCYSVSCTDSYDGAVCTRHRGDLEGVDGPPAVRGKRLMGRERPPRPEQHRPKRFKTAWVPNEQWEGSEEEEVEGKEFEYRVMGPEEEKEEARMMGMTEAEIEEMF